jgi:NitT/TauT family transport system substrate-binding protein
MCLLQIGDRSSAILREVLFVLSYQKSRACHEHDPGHWGYCICRRIARKQVAGGLQVNELRIGSHDIARPRGARRVVSRRTLIAGAGAAAVMSTTCAAETRPEIRLGTLQFGTVQWIADIIRRHDLDTRNGFALQPVTLANTDAGRVSLMAGASDIIVSDWPFVAVQRAAGTMLSFAPFSSSNGGVMVASGSPIRSLADLRSRKLGVAGGPVDKSWLVVQAAARATGHVDLAAEAQLVYGAPPLLGAKLKQGELDAVLTFWNFAAKLEASGFREVISVAQCAADLQLSPHLNLLGFVFHEAWAKANQQALSGFLAAVDQAETLLSDSDPAVSGPEWRAIRPMMDVPDDATFERLKTRFLAGIAHVDPGEEETAAKRLFAILRATGGDRAVGGLEALPPGVFWAARASAT